MPAKQSDPLAISDALLGWYNRHARRLPWRVPPSERSVGVMPDPYRVWLSEVMLQQTTVAAVKSYFDAFIAKWPRVEDLAAATSDDVMRAWAGLGYYSRARNLKVTAEAIADAGGRFPETAEGLAKLPGIGRYTAAAIAAIAFDQAEPVVDGNVERVIGRLFAIPELTDAAKKTIRAHQARLTPRNRPGDFAQAMMDLGAGLCSPKRPACSLCPVEGFCEARRVGDPELFARKPRKAARPTRRGNAYVAVRPDGAILLRRREARGLLGGMTEVPGSHWSGDPLASGAGEPLDLVWRKMAERVVHVFTHFRLELDIYSAETTAPAPEGCWWSSPNDVPQEALPSVMKKVIEAALPGATKRRH